MNITTIAVALIRRMDEIKLINIVTNYGTDDTIYSVSVGKYKQEKTYG